MVFFGDGTDEETYKHINQSILYGNLMNMYFIVMEVNYDDIDACDSICNGYYIIRFPSSPYTLQADLIIDGQVISSGKMVCEGTYFFSITINSHYYVS